jgi:hypothetical protein
MSIESSRDFESVKIYRAKKRLISGYVTHFWLADKDKTRNITKKKKCKKKVLGK